MNNNTAELKNNSSSLAAPQAEARKEVPVDQHQYRIIFGDGRASSWTNCDASCPALEWAAIGLVCGDGSKYESRSLYAAAPSAPVAAQQQPQAARTPPAQTVIDLLNLALAYSGVEAGLPRANIVGHFCNEWNRWQTAAPATVPAEQDWRAVSEPVERRIKAMWEDAESEWGDAFGGPPAHEIFAHKIISAMRQEFDARASLSSPAERQAITPAQFFAALESFKCSDMGAAASQQFSDAVLGAPAERQEAEALLGTNARLDDTLSGQVLRAMYTAFQRGDSVERAHAAVMAVFASPASAETVYDDYCPEPRLAAPSSPSVSGTVDTPEFSALLRAWGDSDWQEPSNPNPLEARDALIAHIDQRTARAVRAAREDAAQLAIKFTAVPRDCLGPATVQMKAIANVGQKIAAAIRTPQAAGTEQEQKQ